MTTLAPNATDPLYAAPEANLEIRPAFSGAYPPLRSPDGRLSRMQYIFWLLTLQFVFLGCCFAVGVGIGFAAGMVGVTLSEGFYNGVGIVLGICVWLPLQLILTIKRCHDMNISGWWSALTVVPVVSLVFFVARSKHDGNRYGQVAPNRWYHAIPLALLLAFALLVLASMVIG